jgi:hypothetical protein
MGQDSRAYTVHDPAPTSTVISPSPYIPEDCPVEGMFYTRVDYFHWNENVDHADFVNESGELTTIGYQFRYDQRRVRGEIFGSQVNYGAPVRFDPSDFVNAHTDYFGLRAEYEWLYSWEDYPNLTAFAGLGTRYWIRFIPADVSNNGVHFRDTEEQWWTIYPYLGLESNRKLKNGPVLYSMTRVGLTAITWEWADSTIVYPRPGVTEQIEDGIRWTHLYLAAFFEGMAWNVSETVYSRPWLIKQPTSAMYTIGLKAGYCF